MNSQGLQSKDLENYASQEALTLMVAFCYSYSHQVVSYGTRGPAGFKGTRTIQGEETGPKQLNKYYKTKPVPKRKTPPNFVKVVLLMGTLHLKAISSNTTGSTPHKTL